MNKKIVIATIGIVVMSSNLAYGAKANSAATQAPVVRQSQAPSGVSSGAATRSNLSSAAQAAAAAAAQAKRQQEVKPQMSAVQSIQTNLRVLIKRLKDKCLDSGCKADVVTVGVIATGSGTAQELNANERKKGENVLKKLEPKAILTQPDVESAMTQEGIKVEEARAACKI